MKRFEFVMAGDETHWDGDCMARALANVGALPYDKAREFCLESILAADPLDFSIWDRLKLLACQADAREGKLPHGTPVTVKFIERMAHLGFAEHRHFDNSRLWTLADLPQTGRWVVCIRDHASAFVDGKVVDLTDWQGRRCYRENGLYEAWEWKP